MAARHLFDDYAGELSRFVDRQMGDFSPSASGSPTEDDSTFNELALGLFRLQFDNVAPYRRLCASLERGPERVAHWTEIPAVPTSGFKELAFTSLSDAERQVVFHSSGTTEQRPSRYFHSAASLALYEGTLWPWFRAHLLADLEDAGDAVVWDDLRFLFLTPPSDRAPHSSLVYMFETVRRRCGRRESAFIGEVDADGAWILSWDRAWQALEESAGGAHRLVLLGAAFSFVQLLDQLAERNLSFALPGGSRVMETGGYKGRSRVLARAELHGLITERLGLPASHIVCEYGMSELSSQAYDRAIPGGGGPRARGKGRPRRGQEAGATRDRAPVERRFQFPPWARVRVVSPETGQEVAEGERGLLRVVDLANMRSVLAVQTEDLGVRRGAGFELVGRSARAEPRGCSLMAAS